MIISMYLYLYIYIYIYIYICLSLSLSIYIYIYIFTLDTGQCLLLRPRAAGELNCNIMPNSTVIESIIHMYETILFKQSSKILPNPQTTTFLNIQS